jgi:dihydrofolate reductase
MAKLIYIANASLDCYSEDRDGGIDWGTPDEEYFGSINDLQRRVGTYLYGRRMYEAMVYWETAPVAGQPTWVVEFTTTWRSATKIVFSKTLRSTASAGTTIEQDFDVELIRQLKADATQDLTVGGTDLAAQAFGAGLVDECHLYLWPTVLGAGKHALSSRQRFDFELLHARGFRSGVVHLHYRVTE